jgi:hypothetical protein
MALNKILAGGAEFEVPDSKMEEIMNLLHSSCTGAKRRLNVKRCPFEEVGRVEERRACCKAVEVS